MAKVTTFTVQSRDNKAGVKLPVRGTRRTVESYIIGMFEVKPATADELIEFGRAGVDIIEAGNGKE